MSTPCVYKYEIASSPTDIQMPFGAEVLHVERQGGLPCIWALVDPTAPTETRTFETFGTGWPLRVKKPASLRYIGTWLESDGVFVWHLFEVLR